MSGALPHAPEHTHCQNCGAALQGPFCHACGQHDCEFHRSFRHVFHEALETYFHFDRSIFRGLYDLLFRPGRMTREFNEGRRIRHVPPLRFYLVISVLFFITIRPGSLRIESLHITLGGEEVIAGDSVALKPAEPKGAFGRWIEEQVTASARQPEQLVERFLHRLPKAMVVCLPLFALLSRVLFWRGPWLYLQHLIMAVHLHTFAFLWLMVVSGFARLAGLAWPAVAALIGWAGFGYAVWYYFAAVRRSLGATRWSTLWKGAVLGGSYGFVLAGAVASTFVWSLLWT